MFNDTGPMIPRNWALRALVVQLVTQVKIEHRQFVRGDMHVREHVAEVLMDLGHGTLRKREQLGKLTFTVRRDASGHRWISLFEIADDMLDRRRNVGKDVK